MIDFFFFKWCKVGKPQQSPKVLLFSSPKSLWARYDSSPVSVAAVFPQRCGLGCDALPFLSPLARGTHAPLPCTFLRRSWMIPPYLLSLGACGRLAPEDSFQELPEALWAVARWGTVCHEVSLALRFIPLRSGERRLRVTSDAKFHIFNSKYTAMLERIKNGLIVTHSSCFCVM